MTTGASRIRLPLPALPRALGLPVVLKLELSQRAAEIYEAKKQPEQRRQLLSEIFSNLTLDGKSLGYSYTETAAAIARVAQKTKELENTFEPTEKGSPKREEALSGSIKTIWLGR